MKRLVRILVLALVSLTPACTGGREAGLQPSQSPPPAASAGTPSPQAPSTSPPGANATPGQTASPASQDCAPVKGGGDTFLVLSAVRVGTHPGFDRVTFEFKEPSSPPASPAAAGTLPRYELTRVDAVTEDGSGDPVQIAGKQLNLIVFRGAAGVDLTTDAPVVTYTGPREFKPDFKILAELERSGDFEATLSWALGLKEARCLKVVELRNPTRLAIDIPH